MKPARRWLVWSWRNEQEPFSQLPDAALAHRHVPSAQPSNTNFSLAIGLCYVAMALVAATGIFIFSYVLHRSAPQAESSPRLPKAMPEAQPISAGGGQ